MSSPFLPDESAAGWAAEIQNSLETFGFVMLNSRVVYEINETIVLPNACIVHGNGAEIRCLGPDFPAFLAKDVDWVRLNNLRITRPEFATGVGNSMATHGDGIVVQNARHVFMDGVQLTDHYNGIVLADCVSPIPHVTNLGTPGKTAYAYLVVAVADRIAFEINRPGVTLTGNAHLSPILNKNEIQWGELLGHYRSIEYRIYRTVGGTSQGLIDTVKKPTSGIWKSWDTGQAATDPVPDSPRYSPMTAATPMGGAVFTCVSRVSMVDTDYCTVFTSETAVKYYQFDVTGTAVTGEFVRVNISSVSTAAEVAIVLANVINDNQPTLLAEVEGNTVVIARGIMKVTETVKHDGFLATKIEGEVARKYAVIAKIDGVRWAHYEVVTCQGEAQLDEMNYNVVRWPRLFGVEGYINEEYEVYRIEGAPVDGSNNGTSTGRIGTVTANDQFNDVGEDVATTVIPKIPANTRNSKVTLTNVQVSHSAPTASNNQYNLQINSVDYLAITNSHFDGAWLDGVKARHQVFSLTWSGGSANYNGKSLNDGDSGDGIDTFAGIYHLDLNGVEFIGNGGNGTVNKTIGWSPSRGNPEFGIPNCTKYRGIVASRNMGNGIQLEGVLDSELEVGEELRGRTRDAIISDCFLHNNNVHGIACNAQGVRVTSSVIRANKQNNVWFGEQASSCTLDGVQLLGASSGALAAWKPSTRYAINDRVRHETAKREYVCITEGISGPAGPTTKARDITDGTVHWKYLKEAAQTYAQVLCSGTVVVKTLAADLALGAGSFKIGDATGVPQSGRVAFGRKVEGAAPADTYECWDYTRVDTTVTLAWERPGDGPLQLPPKFDHFEEAGSNARDVGFLVGARKIRIINCVFNGKELSDLTQVSLDGDMPGLATVSRNNIEILDGADEIEILDNKFRFVTSNANCSPYVAFPAADVGKDGTFSGRILLRHADAYHTHPTNKYQGGIGSEYTSLKYADVGGVLGIGAVKYRKESLLANSRFGWVALGAISTLALHPFGSLVESGWAPDFANGHMHSSAGGSFYMAVPLREVDRIMSVTYSIKGDPTQNILVTLYARSSQGVVTPIKATGLIPETSWIDRQTNFHPYTLAAGETLYIKFDGSGAGLSIGAVHVKYGPT